jgi:hypothetical protein
MGSMMPLVPGRPSVVRIVCAAMVLWCAAVRADVVTFEDLSVPPAGYFNGDPGGLSPGQSVSDPWASGGASFANTFGIDGTYSFPYWTGFAYSNQAVVVSGTAKGDFADQYQALPGSGFGSSTYAIAYSDGATVTLPEAATVAGFRIANNAYAGLTMLNGDVYNFTSPLGPGGWFLVTATGSLGGTTTGSAEYYLADLRGVSPPGVLATWDWFDLSPLGAVDTISFAFTGSDTSIIYGLNTPAYFAMDDLTFTPVPEPSAAAIAVSLAAAGLLARRSRRRAA